MYAYDAPQHGANVHQRFEYQGRSFYPIEYACSRGDRHMVKRLLKVRACVCACIIIYLHYTHTLAFASYHTSFALAGVQCHGG